MVRVPLLLLALTASAVAAPVPDNAATIREIAEAHRNERDVLAQESMAWWTWVMGLTAIGGTVLSAGAAFAALRSVALSRRALTQAEESVTETIKIGQAQSRAYVHAREAKFSEEAPDIIVVVMNTGQTPATYFRIGGDVTMVDRGEVRNSIAIGDYDLKEWPALGAGLDLKVQIGSDETRKVVEAFRDDWAFDEKRLVVQGKIIYGDVFGCEFETPFVFYVHRNELHFRRPVAALEAFRQVFRPA
ncbi:hypothetical protein [Sinorhizobium meliloti]|uniref:hypothetical protein n=1 Tax=Rhizobium meliloti TaxID=382 RepID=UPI003F158320